MKHILIVILIIASFGCQKKTVIDKLFVRGKLFLTDTMSQNSIAKPLGDVTVYLSDNDPENNPNFLQSIKSESDGNFVFNIDPSHSRDYYVYSEYKLGDLLFKNTQHITDNSNVSLELLFDTKTQNGLKLNLRDTTNGYLPQINVYLYNSQLVAQLDDTLGTNAFKKVVSDNNGNVIVFNLEKGVYYINARKRIGSFILDRKLKQITINKNDITRDTILLK